MTHARLLRPVLSSMTLGCLAVVLAPAGCSDDGLSAGTGDASTTADTEVVDGTSVGMDGSGTTSGSADGTGSSGAEGSSESSGGDGPMGGLPCIDDQFVNGPSPGPDYAMFDVPIGSHCQGTNQQDIVDIERVVFLGDSVTVGTRPTGANDFYRSQLADELADLFGLQPPDGTWKQANPLSGTSLVQESGDFASCAEWGARNDDLVPQLEDCFAPEDFDLRTLVVMTMGGNDAAAIAKDAVAGVDAGTLFEELDAMVARHREAIEWLVADPGRFPNGVFVVNANVYEFTDYTGDLLSCPAAGVAGFDANPPNPELLMSSLTLINEEYMQIAQEMGTDVVFMFEGFCGHGFHSDDPQSPCYRGAGSENWFDLTCIHPTPAGHTALAEMFVNVIAE
ncbi:MAG: SGNH/GDSL hydrolase family protein [Myxococcales bacterium]|nr:SGNH/GDSL hydrolase family protein [Myxococcales bacterium]